MDGQPRLVPRVIDLSRSPSILGHENRFRKFDLSNGVKECFERSQREWREGDPLVECN